MGTGLYVAVGFAGKGGLVEEGGKVEGEGLRGVGAGAERKEATPLKIGFGGCFARRSWLVAIVQLYYSLYVF